MKIKSNIKEIDNKAALERGSKVKAVSLMRPIK